MNHGMSKTPTWRSWRAMRDRCFRSSHTAWSRYGGRGVTVCDRWDDFEYFLEDMGARPDGMTLDRVDTNGMYEPSNCRWATPRQQTENRRDSRYLEHNGERMTVTRWAERSRLTVTAIVTRVKAGLSMEEVLAPADRRALIAETCRRGHPRNEANTRIASDGARQCRVCGREWAQMKRRSTRTPRT